MRKNFAQVCSTSTTFVGLLWKILDRIFAFICSLMAAPWWLAWLELVIVLESRRTG